MRPSHIEMGALALGMAVAGCEKPNPPLATHESAAISTYISGAASNTISPALSAVPTAKPTPEQNLGLACPTIEVVQAACPIMPPELKLSNNWWDREARDNNCHSTRIAMAKSYENAMGCLKEIKAYKQPQCQNDTSPGEVTEQEATIAKKIATSIAGANEQMGSALHTADLHAKFCEPKNLVEVKQNQRTVWVTANTLISDIVDTAKGFEKGLGGVTIKPQTPTGQIPRRENLYKP